jgi:hypothetical protein
VRDTLSGPGGDGISRRRPVLFKARPARRVSWNFRTPSFIPNTGEDLQMSDNSELPVGTTFSLGGMMLVVTGANVVEYMTLEQVGKEGKNSYILTPDYILKEGKRMKKPAS